MGWEYMKYPLGDVFGIHRTLQGKNIYGFIVLFVINHHAIHLHYFIIQHFPTHRSNQPT
jgi:hypothetical protein